MGQIRRGRSGHESRVGHFHCRRGGGRRILLPGGHGRAVALSRSSDPPARLEQGGQSRRRADRARSVAAGGWADQRAQADRRVAARSIGEGDGLPADCARGAARDVAAMTIGFALDCGIAVLVAAVAGWTIVTRGSFAAVVGALTEAAIGSGLTGALLLGAAARMRSNEVATQTERPRPALRIAAALLAATVAAALAAAVLLLPDPAPTLAPAAAANSGATGLDNPVTNVLIAFRAMDTMLEKVVLVLALVGVWSLAADRCWGGMPSPPRAAGAGDATAFLAQSLAPLGIVVGIYILWEGADNPGGAFQGGTILAAMWLVLIAGPAVFLVVGLGGLWLGAAFLAYPVAHAKAVILVIEFVMTLTIAVTLALLLAG